MDRFRTVAHRLVLFGVLLFELAAPASAAPGDLDSTFASGGVKMIGFGDPAVAEDVAIQEDGGRLYFEVADDGVGFDFSTSTTGHGLHNMRQRAFAVGATLDVHSAPGAGARVRLELPAAVDDEEHER